MIDLGRQRFSGRADDAPAPIVEVDCETLSRSSFADVIFQQRQFDLTRFLAQSSTVAMAVTGKFQEELPVMATAGKVINFPRNKPEAVSLRIMKEARPKR